jgi:hypothetical protein
LNFLFFCFFYLKILLLWQQAEENVLFWQHCLFFIRGKAHVVWRQFLMYCI